MGHRYLTGQVIPTNGVYYVFHPAHRLIRSVRLLQGDTFPRCSQCADQVSFELQAPFFTAGVNGEIHIYELPVRDQEDSAAAP
jgi:hypothetical protein